MGIPKASRKGKKAWRKNIDAQEVEAFLTEESHQQVREPSVKALKDEDLFVLDKEADDSAVPAALRKRQQHQQKLLRPALILASHKEGIKPLHVPTKHKAKGPAKPLPGSLPGGPAAVAAAQEAAAAAAAAAAAQGRRKPLRRRGLKVTDIWSEAGPNPEADWVAPVSGTDLIKLGKRKQQQQQQQQDEAAAAAAAAAAVPAAKRSKRRAPAPAPAPKAAVEVDLPGCSFNPEHEAHQDALAVAVAAEYRKQLAQELAPKPPSLFAPAGFKPQSELDALLVDAEPDEDPEVEQAAAAQPPQLPAGPMQDENAIALDDSEDEDAAAAGAAAGAAEAAAAAGPGAGGGAAAAAVAAVAATSRAAQRAAVERKTRKDRNREARRKQQEAEAAAAAALKQQRKELEQLEQLQAQLWQEEQEKEAVRLRKQVAAAERAAEQPPKLGKHKFEPAAVAVLTSDDVTGSLREIKPCFNLAADRFKSLQKRGLVEPRKPKGRKQGKRVQYVAGERQERAREQQQEIEDIRKARKKAAKSGSAAAAAAVVSMAGGKGSKRRQKQAQQAQQQQPAQLAPGSIMPLEVAAGDEAW